jgi:hypothetical protein
MSTALAWGLLGLFAIGLAAAILGDRWIRLGGVTAMLGTAAVALSGDIGAAAALWVVGPALAVLLPGPQLAGRPLSFDPFARRAVVIGALILGATLAAIQFPLSDLPGPAAVVLWNLSALGLGWVFTARDRFEFVTGAVLALAGGSAIQLAGSNVGLLGALIAGGLAAVPALRLVRVPLGGLSYALAIGAGLTAVLLGLGRPGGVSAADLTLSWPPPTLLGVAVLLIGAAATASGARGLAAVTATLMLITTLPAVRWTALAASVALLWEPEDQDRWLAWAGVALLAASAVLGSSLDAAPRLRMTIAALAVGWLLLVASRRPSALQVGIASMFLLTQTALIPASAAGRLQLLAALTAAFLLARMLIDRRDGRIRLSAGLIIIGLATLTPTGTLAAVLLLLDGFLIEATTGTSLDGMWRWLKTLARSGWPPTVAFAGRILAVVAAIATNPPLGVVALALLVALLMVPLADSSAEVRVQSSRGWALTLIALSLAAGIAPAWVASLGHL